MVSSIYGLIDTIKSQVLLKLPKQVDLFEPQIEEIKNEIQSQIPSQEQIKTQICQEDNIESAKETFNNYKKIIVNIGKKIEGLDRSITSMDKSLQAVIKLLNTLSDLIDILSIVIDVISIAVVGLKAGLAVLSVPVINGATVKLLSDGIDKIETDIKKYSLVIKSISIILKYITPRLEEISSKIAGFQSLVLNLMDLVENFESNIGDCLKDRLSDEFAKTEDDTRIEDVSNMDLESLIKLSNSNTGVKIEEFKSLGLSKNISYNVRTILQEDLKI